MVPLKWDALSHKEKRAVPEVYLMIRPASAGNLHRRLSPCHKAPPPPPDLGQMQGAEPIASPKGPAVMASDPVCLALPPQHSAEVIKNISLSKPPRWWHFSQAIATEGLWAGPWDAPVSVVPFLPSTAPMPRQWLGCPVAVGAEANPCSCDPRRQ